MKSVNGQPIGGKSGQKWPAARAMMDMMTKSNIPSTKCRRRSDPRSEPSLQIPPDAVTSSCLQLTSLSAFCLPVNNAFVYLLFDNRVQFILMFVFYFNSLMQCIVQNVFVHTVFCHCWAPETKTFQ